jgi:hypothetical protein
MAHRAVPVSPQATLAFLAFRRAFPGFGADPPPVPVAVVRGGV